MNMIKFLGLALLLVISIPLALCACVIERLTGRPCLPPKDYASGGEPSFYDFPRAKSPEVPLTSVT